MKHSLLRLTILALVLTINTIVFAGTFVVNGIKYSTTSSSTVEVIRNSYSGNIVIPESVNYIEKMYSVTSIGKDAFKSCGSLASVTIPNSVTSIGDSAFSGCTSLASVTIPNSVTSIGGGAFSHCSSLESITIPNSVTSIGYYAFNDCSNLASVTIPNSVTSIGRDAFTSCISLNAVISLNTTPPEISSNTFDNSTYNKATLQVPIGCKTIYWLHPYWENFFNIEEIEVTSINNIHINGKSDDDIYNLNGIKVSSNNLGKGIYIKNGKKVVIK